MTRIMRLTSGATILLHAYLLHTTLALFLPAYAEDDSSILQQLGTYNLTAISPKCHQREAPSSSQPALILDADCRDAIDLIKSDLQFNEAVTFYKTNIPPESSRITRKVPYEQASGTCKAVVDIRGTTKLRTVYPAALIKLLKSVRHKCVTDVGRDSMGGEVEMSDYNYNLWVLLRPSGQMEYTSVA